MSFAEGEELPPRVRSKYAARCFILRAEKVLVLSARNSNAHAQLGTHTFGC